GLGRSSPTVPSLSRQAPKLARRSCTSRSAGSRWPKPNTRDTSRKVAALISQKCRKAKQEWPERAVQDQKQPQPLGDFVAPNPKAKSSSRLGRHTSVPQARLSVSLRFVA